MVHIWGLTVDQICNLKYFAWIWSLFVHGVEIKNKKGNKFFFALTYEGWFPPILTFKFCYAILLGCYSVFESYYSLSNSVIYFSDFIIPLWILLLSFQFCYSLSSYVMQFSNPVIRLYSPLMQFRILLFPFKFCCSYLFSNSIMPLWILLFLFQFYYSLSINVRPNPGLRLFGRLCSGDQ